VPRTTRIGLFALALAAACEEAPLPLEAGAPRGADRVASPVTARGVELRVPQPGGDVVIAGDTFALGAGGSASIVGDVRLRSEGAMRFEATAARASLANGGRTAVLEGGVRAVLEFDRDAGAADD